MDNHPPVAPLDPALAVHTVGLVKRYGQVMALDGFDLSVRRGTVHGLLGPNGAGKTTAVRVLTTLTEADAGAAQIAGADLGSDRLEVRRRIGLAGQYAAVDEVLTGRQNLELFGRLFHLGRPRARTRATELLEQFALTDAADKGVGAYSGGMRRRLDLAASMILAPQVMFLDEPTTGLDPRGRAEVWEAVRALVGQGTTVLLTTQYLDEADQLADRITVIDQGRQIADGTPAELKRAVGGAQIEVTVADPAQLDAAEAACAAVSTLSPLVDRPRRRVVVPVEEQLGSLAAVAARLAEAGVAVEDVGLRRPTLDEVFLRLTGHRTDEEPELEEATR
ncbi:ATP-binding cassette domain-containing protein [Ornithinimicrobium sp. F0845]|uniref:ATP-binding cassette domain-containing protein n=1 Tax=Ornithinimicrobium sp. F0845 TaxID=2926412 RepID=UPI001FF32B3F|nr:ATP-binding cassette domain-containing protein [Ornithinimicrobium sp. F0845]MCK0114031.1 ATP-binding cassette domain-containing protein [Ornithinimicrobium sp. F0845]